MSDLCENLIARIVARRNAAQIAYSHYYTFQDP